MSERNVAAPLDSLLAALYEATDPGCAWTPFLSALCSATGVDNAALVIHDLRTSETVTAWCHFDPEEIRRYQGKYAQLNPWMPSPDHVAPTGGILRTESVIPVEDLRKTEFYREWGKQNNVVHGIALNLGIEEGRFTYLSLNNGEESGALSAKAIRLVELLAPHISRVVRLQSDRLRLESFHDALEMTSGAVLIVNSMGYVIEATTSVRKLMPVSFPIRVDGQRKIQAIDATKQPALLKAIQMHGNTRYQVVRLSENYMAAVVRMETSTAGRHSHGLRLLSIIDRRTTHEAADIFGPLLKLSRAEVRLLKSLLSNGTLSAAADTLGVSRETAKTQLRRMFNKTGTKRQSDLLQLFASLGVIAKSTTAESVNAACAGTSHL